jgi:hypothetical protein
MSLYLLLIVFNRRNLSDYYLCLGPYRPKLVRTNESLDLILYSAFRVVVPAFVLGIAISTRKEAGYYSPVLKRKGKEY